MEKTSSLLVTEANSITDNQLKMKGITTQENIISDTRFLE